MTKFMIAFVVAVVLPNFIISTPITSTTTEALVITSDDVSSTTNKEVKVDPRPPELKSMHVVSNIRNRYAQTVVTSKYINPDETSQEATFSIILPDTAFISGFIMEIKGKKYKAYVREKEEAKKEYDEAVASGLGAAHVAVSARDSNKFTVSVNVEPLSKVVFNLTYEELLIRKHGKYEMVINLHPGQLIKDLGVDVNINETRKIVQVAAPALRSGNEISDDDKTSKNEYATIETLDKEGNAVHVSFSPTVEQQKEMIKKLNSKEEDKGIAGQFIVEYDVERDPQGGEVLVNDGYFVHFFAPSDLKPIPKHVVFVLDVSGSMVGRKIEQLRKAMKVILSELNEDDFFSLVKFNSYVHVLGHDHTWHWVEIPKESELPEAIPASKENIMIAQEIVEQMIDESLTNIYDALIVGLRLTSKGISNLKEEDNKHKPQPIMVFLTDGQANVGEYRSDKMIEMVESRNNVKKTAIFTLAFGDDANKDFLKELGIKNSGFLRNIYEAADASLQLQDFYKQISSPLLTNINFKYSENQVKEVTKHKFGILFKGSEFVVAGRVEKPEEKFITVEGSTLVGNQQIFYPHIIPIVPIIPKPELKEEYGSLERLWAYMTIKQLLDKKYETKTSDKNVTESETPEKQALKLALKYSFVTPITSLVVVKPNKTETAAPEQSELRPGSQQHVSFSSPRVPLIVGGAAVSFASPPGPPSSYPRPSYQSPVDIRFTSSYPLFLSTTLLPTVQNPIEELPWLTPLVTNTGDITINNKNYLIGNNETTTEQKSCQVPSLNLSGNCTLISACPKIYPKLDSFETYEKYFCTLDSEKYAGVCCIDEEIH